MKITKTITQYEFYLEYIEEKKECYVGVRWLNPVMGGLRSGSMSANSLMSCERSLKEFVGSIALSLADGHLTDHKYLVKYSIEFAQFALTEMEKTYKSTKGEKNGDH